ncbi:MAG: hypothetical protein AB7S70_11460 [Hyphomicrobium sp.]|uniref:hypothetical protein n=1 Tax=Hyphomicrobium sp. TaxID=82 RepID=UPI003D0C25A6
MTRIAHRRSLALMLLGALMFGAAPLSAQEPGTAPAAGGEAAIQGQQEATPPPIDMTKDWPCVQGKVETLSVGAIWDGPSIEGIKGWYRDKELVDLVDLAVQRRIPEEHVDAAIETYAKAQPEAERDTKLTTLFAAMFDKFSGQRRTVMSGIEKYQRSQKARAIELEHQSSAIVELEGKQAPGALEDDPELAKARENFNWAQRIFQERQSSIPLACELPVLIEERLYAVARAIRSQMKS